MRKKFTMKKALLITGLLALTATPALAAEGNAGWATGFYATASVGQARADNETLETLEGAVTGFSVDDTDTGYSAGIGYEFNKYVAIEAGYVNLGEASGTYSDGAGSITGSGEGTGFYFGPKLSLPITDAFSVFGKIGLFAWDLDAKASGTGAYAIPTTTANYDGTDIYFGLGLAYNITETLGVKAEWTRYNLDADGSDTDVDFISAGLVFKFGKLL